jgi:hypothetical protein
MVKISQRYNIVDLIPRLGFAQHNGGVEGMGTLLTNWTNWQTTRESAEKICQDMRGSIVQGRCTM